MTTAMLKVTSVIKFFLTLLITYATFSHAASITPVFFSDKTLDNNKYRGGNNMRRFDPSITPFHSITKQHQQLQQRREQRQKHFHHPQKYSDSLTQKEEAAAFIQPIRQAYQTKIPQQIRFTIGFCLGYKFKFEIIYALSRTTKVAAVAYGISEIWNFTNNVVFDARYQRKSVMWRVNGWVDGYRRGVRGCIGRPCLDLNMRENGGIIGFGCGTVLGIVF